MFGQLGWGEILVILLVGLFVFGPERLPGVAKDAGKMLRQLRSMANGVRDDIRSELGPEVADLDLASLNPRTFVAKHLLGDDDEDETVRQRIAGRASGAGIDQ
jgi:sec-independent protein translocase protein TatB